MKRVLSLILSVLMVVSVFSFGAVVGSSAEASTLVARDAEWQYYTILGEEIVLPEGWNTVGFDTTSWTTGKAPFTGTAYANDAANTKLDAEGKHITNLFVTTFTATNVAEYAALSMNFRYDQDPIVYINGTQVYSAAGWNDAPVNVDLSGCINLLKEGENTIAVYMHNPVGGGGYHMDLELIGGTPAAVDADGNIVFKSATATHQWNGTGDAYKIFDGDQNSIWGTGFVANMSCTIDFYGYAAVSEITLSTKNEGTINGVDLGDQTAGLYDLYVGNELVATGIPAKAAGYTVSLEEAVAGKSITVVITEWYSNAWAGVAELSAKGEIAEAPAVETIEIGKYGSGWENWSGATYLYITAPAGLENYTWTLDITDGSDSEGTITMKPTSIYPNISGSATLYRFAVCNNTYENSFFPNAGTNYSVKVSLADADGAVKYVSDWTAGYLNNDTPIPGKLTVNTHFGVIENWSGKTYFIVGATPAAGASDALYDGLKTKDLTMKVTLVDETAGKTYVIPEYAFDVPGAEFYENWFLRVAFCDYGIVPVSDHQYTISLAISDGNKVIYEGTSATGLYTGGNDAFKNDGAIIPETIPYSHVDLDVAFAGHQLGTDGSSIRFIGSVNDTAFENVDLKITVEGLDKSFTLPTTKVFKTLNGANGAAVTVVDSGVEAPLTIDADYLFGYAITGIDAGTYTFTIVPTATTAGGLVVTGETATLTVTIG